MISNDGANPEYACVLCDGPLHDWMSVPSDWRRPRDPRNFELYWCDACSFGQVQPRPSQADVRSFYETEYYTHERLEAEAEPPTFFERIKQHLAWRADRGLDITAELVHRLVRRKPARICEFGCGSGTLLQALGALGHSVVGIEPDPAARQVAEERGIQTYPDNAEAPPAALPNGSFDVVIMCHVLEHCLDPRRAIANARKALRPGGFLICETPNNVALGLKQSGTCWPWLDVPRHLNFFTAESLKRISALAGLNVTGIEFAGYSRHFDRKWLREEERICAALQPSPRNSRTRLALQNWVLLGRTAIGRGESKYDSVRVVAEAASA
ncbi:MAG: class I SAM-dependent methyltransferase [Planctomycetes bacterium]|nr:class I SAM-dependent methyltransferase [Planctomycetota bacterium]